MVVLLCDPSVSCRTFLLSIRPRSKEYNTILLVCRRDRCIFDTPNLCSVSSDPLVWHSIGPSTDSCNMSRLNHILSVNKGIGSFLMLGSTVLVSLSALCRNRHRGETLITLELPFRAEEDVGSLATKTRPHQEGRPSVSLVRTPHVVSRVDGLKRSRSSTKGRPKRPEQRVVGTTCSQTPRNRVYRKTTLSSTCLPHT